MDGRGEKKSTCVDSLEKHCSHALLPHPLPCFWCNHRCANPPEAEDHYVWNLSCIVFMMPSHGFAMDRWEIGDLWISQSTSEWEIEPKYGRFSYLWLGMAHMKRSIYFPTLEKCRKKSYNSLWNKNASQQFLWIPIIPLKNFGGN